MTDIVDTSSRQWRMQINFKKSEIVVVRDAVRCVCCAARDQLENWANQMIGFLPVVRTRDVIPAGACILCSPWVCRGQRLKIVRKYKYPGI